MEGGQIELENLLLKLQVNTQSDWPVAYAAQVATGTSGDVPVAVLKLQVTVDPKRQQQQNGSGAEEVSTVSSQSSAPTQRLFTCKYCKKKFSSYLALAGYVISHKQERALGGNAHGRAHSRGRH
ncbi:hypothetical protein CRG98_009033 [Punica granatum]|uniref:C2H2-type domain-containing protein n=1 Tax=Punica granatum TaxID=22663 RepID=A0A2I0KPV3_PUNGR|nr:hypothetical protein CRG98_009033 [Punica granatum]